MEYTIVDRTEIEATKYYGKWQELFYKLPTDKAIKFESSDKAQLLRLGNAIQGTLRYNRIQNKIDSDFSLHRRVVRNENGTFTLFVWKEEK